MGRLTNQAGMNGRLSEGSLVACVTWDACSSSGSCSGVLGRVEQLGKLTIQEAYSDGVEQGDTGRERRERHRGTLQIF
jgi:hypothetical protein